MIESRPDDYGSACAKLIRSAPAIELGPGKPHGDARERLESLTFETMFPAGAVRDADAARCCQSGLWLLHSFLDESHSISQEISSANGSFWHGIMHRREPDYSNSKYWFRRVGEHPIFPSLTARARDLSEQSSPDRHAKYLSNQASWDPFQFVDLCEHVERGRSASHELCCQIARAEWMLLFDHCYREAVGRAE